MLFNSSIFILFFLPLTLSLFFLIGGRGHHRVAISWLVAASLFFYSWWNPLYLSLILSSMFFNYALGVSLGAQELPSKTLLTVGVAANLLLLGYFKYANFLIENLNELLGTQWIFGEIALPLAISFFTFQQIAYLIDAYRGTTREYNFLHYCLFVTFFPQLIAGPIVHHKEMLPQFARDAIYRLNLEMLSVGITVFTFGLFKKVILADNVAPYATSVFRAAQQGLTPSFLEAWGGALAYTCQIYFDFSGYSDMAIGLALMFGIRLPMNFDSPYQATSIIDFWRRWHITLSRFLRDYLYIPLGGNRKGAFRRYLNLFLTMLIGGLWHGAGWTFIIWGALHGCYLIVNHAWHGLRKRFFSELPSNGFTRATGIALTFLAVVVGWVFFRAETPEAALQILASMADLDSLSSLTENLSRTTWEAALFPNQLQQDWLKGGGLIGGLLLLAFLAPNTQQIMFRYRPVYETIERQRPLPWIQRRIEHRFSISWGLFIIVMQVVAFFSLSRGGEFLYFNF